MHKTTLRSLYTFMLALGLTCSVSARQLSPDEAMQRAAQFTSMESGPRLKSTMKSPARAKAAPKLKLAYTSPANNSENVPAFYVFNKNEGSDEGFIIASGDDRLRPVLAITDNGTFNPANVPPALKWWLEQYELEVASYLNGSSSQKTSSLNGQTALNAISKLREIPKQRISSSENYASWNEIEPLVTTKWNQDEPFNNLCPVYNNERTVTGCVATAFAQIINYHKFADLSKYKGQTKSYTIEDKGLNVSFTFPDRFDFDNMIDRYSYTYSGYTATPDFNDTQAAAVAELMKACGVAVDMNYGLANAGGSGAMTIMTPSAAIEYFGYDESSQSYSRSDYQTPEWEKLVYDELAHNRPVIYSGRSTEGGHAFVCDGYLYDGLFHINWGWGGASDGYFALSTLNPADQGIGSFEGGYNSNQAVCSFVLPDDPDKPALSSPYKVMIYGNTEYVNDNGEDYISMPWGVSSAPESTVDVTVGAVVTDLNNNIKGEVGEYTHKGFPVGAYYPSFYIPIDFSKLSLPAGSYYIYSMYKVGDMDWEKITPYSADHTNRILLTVDSNGNRTFGTAQPDFIPEVYIADFVPDGEFYIENTLKANVILTNKGNGDFNGQIVGEYSDGSSIMSFSIAPSAIIAAGQTVSISTSADLSDMSAGNYTFRAGKYVDNNIEYFEGSFDVVVKEGSAPGIQIPDGPVKVTSASNMNKFYLPGDEITVPVVFSVTESQQIYLTYDILDHATKKVVWSWDRIYGYNLPVGNALKAGTRSFGNIPESLTPGVYDFVLCQYNNTDGTSKEISARVPISVGLEKDNIVYQFGIDASGEWEGLVADRIKDENISEVVIPSEIEYGNGTADVTDINEDMLAHNKNVELVDLPASLKSIGFNAFGYTSNLKYIFLRGKNPLSNPQTAFYLSNPDLKVYVPSEEYDGYSPWESVGKVYSIITSFSAEETNVNVSLGNSKDIKILLTPEENIDPGFFVKVNSQVVKASYSNGVLTITGLEKGSAVVTLSNAQPGLTPIQINVTVGEVVKDPFDIDDDGKVDIYDVVQLVDKIIRNNIDLTLHDFNKDSKVDVADIVILVNAVLNGETTRGSTTRGAGTIMKSVEFDSVNSWTALQTDVVLTDGSTIENMIINRNIARSHSLAYREIEPGRYRVILYSPMNLPIAVADGETPFSVVVKDGEGNYELENTLSVNADIHTSDVNDALIDSDILSKSIYDIQGRQVSDETKGIVIERIILKDGRVIVRKIRK